MLWRKAEEQANHCHFCFVNIKLYNAKIKRFIIYSGIFLVTKPIRDDVGLPLPIRSSYSRQLNIWLEI